MRARLPLLASSAVAAVSLGILRVLAAGGWYAPTGRSAVQYCETLHPGLVKQPANTWSNLGFVVVGLAIGVLARRDALDGRGPRNRMRDTAVYPSLYAAAATFLGPGSMAMHASTTDWGRLIDSYSMQLWIAFPVCYGFVRLKNLSVPVFLSAYAALVALLGLGVLADAVPGTIVFGALVAVFCLVELAVRLRAPAGGRYAWLGLAAAAFALAFAVWLPSHTGGPLCAPGSLLQGHAAWHLLSSVAVGAIYLFYRSETAPA